MTRDEVLLAVDPILARRYDRLAGLARSIAIEGIDRHLAACARVGVDPDRSALREILEDALNGRAVYAEKGDIRICT